MTTDESFSFAPPRTALRLATPWVVWAFLMVMTWGRTHSHSHNTPEIFPFLATIVTIICGYGFLVVLFPPTLTATREGISWKRRLRSPVTIPWGAITELRATEQIESRGRRDFAVCRLYVISPDRTIHIHSRGSLELSDVRAMARVIDTAIRRYNLPLELDDPDDLVLTAESAEKDP